MGADGPHRGEGGFTLLEMLVALSIISIAALTLVPRLIRGGAIR